MAWNFSIESDQIKLHSYILQIAFEWCAIGKQINSFHNLQAWKMFRIYFYTNDQDKITAQRQLESVLIT